MTDANVMQFNVCKTCGARDGRAGILVNDECKNCSDTRTSNEITFHADLNRTDEELLNTSNILYPDE